MAVTTTVTFLGGPADGLNMVVPGEPPEYRIARQESMAKPGESRLVTYVRYRRTQRVMPDGRRVYSLVTAD